MSLKFCEREEVYLTMDLAAIQGGHGTISGGWVVKINEAIVEALGVELLI
jgi:hypothetical protein